MGELEFSVSQETKDKVSKEDIIELIYSLIVGDASKLLKNVHVLGIDRSLASDILVLINKDLASECESRIDVRMEILAEALVSSNPSQFPSKPVVRNLMLLLSNGFGGVGNSRGLSQPLLMLASEFLKECPKDKSMLSSILLASVDSPSHMDKIMKDLDPMLTLVMKKA